jgi:hypothetical protein
VKEERASKERINLLEKELATLTEKLEETSASLKEMDDLKLEIKQDFRKFSLFGGATH